MSLTSVCAPGEGQSGAGSRAGTRALERGRGDRHWCSWWPSARGEVAAAAGGPDTPCPPARVSTAVSRRVQPSSPAARAAAGGLSQHLPAVSHSPLRDTGGCAHTRARLPPHAPFGAKNQNSKAKDAGIGERGRRRCADSGVSWQRRGNERGEARPSPSVCPEKPGARGQRRQDLHPAHAPPLRPGARLCRRPFLTCRVSWPGGWGCSADAGDEELGVGGSGVGRSREEPRRCTAAEGGWSPQQSPRILR